MDRLLGAYLSTDTEASIRATVASFTEDVELDRAVTHQ
jgi:hypothetical protein